jgi:hypothetical protein
MRNRQRPQQQGIDQRKDRGAGGDAGGHREDGSGREHGIPDQDPNGITNVSQHVK